MNFPSSVNKNYPNASPFFPWNINSISRGSNPKSLSVSGWCLPCDGIQNNTVIYCNFRPPANLKWSINEEFSSKYPLWPSSRISIFEAEYELDSLSNPEELVFEIRNSSGDHVHPKFKIYYPMDTLESLKIPDPKTLVSIGAPDEHFYIQSGCTLAKGFNRVMTTVANKPFSSFQSILDWGCGSGRVIQHVQHLSGEEVKISGIDVDVNAVNWCKANLSSSLNISSCDLTTPTNFEANSFDIIYAYSVLTHLRENDAVSWINEMHRILKPGGYFLFTTLGVSSLSWLFPYGNPAVYSELICSGIYDKVPNTDLDEEIDDKDYYRNVWVSNEYVRNIWGNNFNYCYNESTFHFYQDLHVFQKPNS